MGNKFEMLAKKENLKEQKFLIDSFIDIHQVSSNKFPVKTTLIPLS